MNSGVDGRKNFSFLYRKDKSGPTEGKNLQVNDVVIVKDDDTPRNQWEVCCVIKALPDKDGLVHKVKLEVGSQYLASNGKRNQLLATLERPIHKLVLLSSTQDD